MALVLSKNSSTIKIGSKNGLVGITLDLKMNFIPKNLIGKKVLIPNSVTSLLFILDHMLQCKIQLTPYVQKTVAMGGTSVVSESEDTTLSGTCAMGNSKKSSSYDMLSKEIVHSWRF